MNLISLILATAGIFSVAGICWSLFLIWRDRFSAESKSFNNRIQGVAEMVSSGASPVMRLRRLSQFNWLNDQLSKINWAIEIDSRILKTGLKITVSDFIFISAGMGFLGFISVSLLADSSLAIILTTSLLFASPYLIMTYLMKKRQSQLEEQLPDVFDFIARSMQAGHSFNASLHMAADEAPEPVGSEFQIAFNQVNLGMPMQQSLAELAARIDCADMRYFAIAVVINREVGGDLSGLLKGVSELIRERLRLKLSIKALSAEGKTSAWILGGLPFILGSLLYLMNPEFVAPLWREEIGRKLVIYALILVAFGVFWMNQISKVRA